jgi:hypothetical protein
VKKAPQKKNFCPIAAWNAPLAPKPWPRTANKLRRCSNPPIHRRAPKRGSRSGALDHDQIIVLPLKAGCRKIRGAGTQQSPVDLIAQIPAPTPRLR